MKILLDANLSWRLISLLNTTFKEVIHVAQCDLSEPAKDIEIWNWAEENEAITVTNDEDFYYFSLDKGFPPKIILLRTVNLSTKSVAEVLIRNHLGIISFSKSTDHGVLEIIK